MKSCEDCCYYLGVNEWINKGHTRFWPISSFYYSVSEWITMISARDASTSDKRKVEFKSGNWWLLVCQQDHKSIKASENEKYAAGLLPEAKWMDTTIPEIEKSRGGPIFLASLFWYWGRDRLTGRKRAPPEWLPEQATLSGQIFGFTWLMLYNASMCQVINQHRCNSWGFDLHLGRSPQICTMCNSVTLKNQK